jgi:hypothetical protein
MARGEKDDYKLGSASLSQVQALAFSEHVLVSVSMYVCDLSGLYLRGMSQIKSYILDDRKAFKKCFFLSFFLEPRIGNSLHFCPESQS